MPDGVSFCMFGPVLSAQSFQASLIRAYGRKRSSGAAGARFSKRPPAGLVRRPADKDINRAESPIKSGAAKGSSRRSQPSSQAGIPIQRINRYMEAI